MASLDDYVLRPLLDLRSERNPQMSVHPHRLELSPTDSEELEGGTREGYAAIDPGSTGTRAVIAVAEIDKVTGKRNVVNILRIQDFREDDDRDRRTTRGEWPSKCCPFDGPPYHVGYDADSQVKKRTISIKAIPYFRAQDDDGHPFTKALYDHSKSLPSENARQDFDDALDAILFNFLSNKVVQRILGKCKATGVKLRSLALCVPQTWSRRETPIQEYLGPILDETVSTERVETMFALEAQCQAQHLISKYPRELRDCNEIMVLDFGVRGGYELWEIGIGHCIDKAMVRNSKRFPQSRRHVIRSKLLDGFFNSKARINFDNPHRLHADLVTYYNDSKASYTVSITAEQLKQQWESAFRESIDLATQNIRRVARTGRRLKILLTGGSANSQNLRSEIQNVCNKLCEQGFDVTCIVVAKQLDVVLAPKWSIAEGAACCHATTMDVEEFFDLGAAFGLQTRMATADEGEWTSETGQLLFFKENGVERHHSVDVEIDGTKRKFRIIANPFQMVSRYQEHRRSVPVQDSYDVWDLVLEYLPSSGGEPLSIPNGRHILEVAEMVCNGREAILVLRMRPNLSSYGARRSERILKKLAIDDVCDWSLLFDLPLTSCGPSNLVELDIDRIRGRFWKLEGDADSCPPTGHRELSVELGTPSSPPAKRRRTDGLFAAGPDSQGD
ncbi:hypothetical protein INS49_004701 [Diaporthe citri]|uniref:uncharacterized protein n=1 Tax=Diaporthe citri TaxID=83186 RepID=UPI001C7EC5F5|nr:uncharacterized protein INS49_004701 [Diaporthe citri]KAG6354683.1 hypothetical protein INS49_004701 [Diaporthe citri]